MSKEPSAAERAFADGYRAVVRGDYGVAVRELDHALDREPRGELASDVRYWRAIALARAGKTAEARGAMNDFVLRYPRSARADEVAAMLGWLWLDAGQRGRARPLFERAAKADDPAVRTSALQGLRALQ